MTEQRAITVTVLMKLIACFVLCAAVAALGCTGESPQQTAVSEQLFDDSLDEQNETRETVASIESNGSTGLDTLLTTTEQRNGAEAGAGDAAIQDTPDASAIPTQPFADCDNLLAHYRATTLQSVLDGSYRSLPPIPGTAVWLYNSVGAGVVSATGTNLHVAGVDEADFVKTDGDRAYLLTSDYLEVYTLRSGRSPELTSRTELPKRDYSAHDFGRQGAAYSELLIGSGKALLFRSFRAGSIDRNGDELEPIAELIEVDLTNAAAPRVLRTLELSGALYRLARLVNGQVRVIFGHLKQPALTYPYTFDVDATQAQRNIETAERENTEIVHRAALTAWHPTYALTDHETAQRTAGPVIPCDQTYLSVDPSVPPHQAVSAYLMTFDLSAGIGRWQSTLLLDGFHVAHATADNVYIASHHGFDEERTLLHKLGVDSVIGPTYLGSVAVPGRLHDRWSLDEYEDRLRFLSYRSHDAPATGTAVAVTEPDAWRMAPGKTAILPSDTDRFALPWWTTSVAFVDDRAYALYGLPERCEVIVLDLATNSARSLVGQSDLHCRGSYLHRLGDGMLLVIGVKGFPPENIWVGLIKSTQDTSPRVMHTINLPAQYLKADRDHRAFLFLDNVAWVLASTRNDDHFAFGIRLDDDIASIEAALQVDGLTERAMVLGEQLYLFTRLGQIQTFALSDYSDLGPPS